MTNDELMDDPLALHAAVEAVNARSREARRRYQRLTRELFSGKAGRQWLVMAMARHNFMGSVFTREDEMSATAAAYRDGTRSVFSDILNTAAADGGTTGPGDPEEDEEGPEGGKHLETTRA